MLLRYQPLSIGSGKGNKTSIVSHDKTASTNNDGKNKGTITYGKSLGTITYGKSPSAITCGKNAGTVVCNKISETNNYDINNIDCDLSEGDDDETMDIVCTRCSKMTDHDYLDHVCEFCDALKRDLIPGEEHVCNLFDRIYEDDED